MSYLVMAPLEVRDIPTGKRPSSAFASTRRLKVPVGPVHVAEPHSELTLCGLSTEGMETWGVYPATMSLVCGECKTLVGQSA